ncbi:peptidase [Sphingomonas melonis]|uniref:Peptidase n=1 Tax=Sphingomonas melonis TaxID=152682 RepID=A0A0D1MED0_9SPHN|nr:PepSY-associated TM helix domain-containing protein [Sphingomonas melonis]KIU26071.1 peptidase [Sphingomonas melonis]
MRLLDAMHRWTGGLIGLVLLVMAVTGTILLHQDSWIMVPHARDAPVSDPARLGAAVTRMMRADGPAPQSIVLAGEGLGLHQIRYAHGRGAYADQSGKVVTRWSSEWQRPEVWLFDLHHHLLSGAIGETVIGVAALCGIFFVLSGTILWWRTRRTLAPRLLPRRLSRSAIVRHHRDLGILVAPLLLLSFLTGAIMVFRPLAIVFGPGTPAAIALANRPPAAIEAGMARGLDWSGIMRVAADRFPRAQIRVLTLPSGRSKLVALRLRQPNDWVENGRTRMWFSPATGGLVAVRDARGLPAGVAAYDLMYPLHAAHVGGWAYRLVMTLSGAGLSLLGSLAVWSFWFRRPRRTRSQPG